MGTIYQNGILYSGSTGQNYSDMGGATSTTAGVHGLVPAPSAGDQAKVLKGDGTWKSVNYSEVNGTPTLGTASAKDVPTSGNASTTQVVMGDDTRLTDARPSSDVVHTYSATSEAPISGKGVAEALPTFSFADHVLTITTH